MQFVKLEYFGKILLDMLLAGICKAASSGAPSFSLARIGCALKSEDKEDYGC